MKKPTIKRTPLITSGTKIEQTLHFSFEEDVFMLKPKEQVVNQPFNSNFYPASKKIRLESLRQVRFYILKFTTVGF